jgi:signal transduction histidine kinase
LFFVSLTAYAIIKHRLMNVRLVITRSLLFSLLVLVVSGLFTTAALLASRVFQITSTRQLLWVNLAVATLVVLTLQPLRNLLAKATDKIFFKGQVDYPAVAQRLSSLIAETLERDQLLHKFARQFKKELKLKKVDILFCQTLPQMCSLYYAFPSKSVVTQSPDIKKHLWNDYGNIVSFFSQYPQVKVREEEERKVEDLKPGIYHRRLGEIVQELESRAISVIIPVISDHKEKAFICIGDKISGDIFDDRDIKLFDLLKSQLSSALEKSRLYEEAKGFTVVLKKKVDEATQELRDANARLRELDRAKTLFLSVTSHQLRTPLAGIKGFLSMVLDGDFGATSEEIKKVLEEVYANTNRLIRLVNTFLNVSRIESGRLTIMQTDTNMVELARKVVQELQFSARDKGLSVLLEAESDSVMAYIDSDKVEDVVINLVDNAIKYTEKGKIVVRVMEKDSRVRIEVEDTGQGLNESEIRTLFHKFVRGSRSFQLHTDGSGLGLYIAKRVVDMHKGEIGVESGGEDKGSVFWFELPRK